MHVDPAKIDDVPRMAELLGMLFDQEAEFAPDRAAQEKALRLILADPYCGELLVLRERGRIIGVANVILAVSTALGAPVAILDDLVVDAAHRGRGGGSMLLAAAIDFARKSGCRRITLNTDHDNRAAQRLYHRHGFEVSSMKSMRKML